jgi:putative glycosyltransferase (TIGR04348 family)
MLGESIESGKALDKKSVVIVTPATTATNNGNSHTATRWAQFLSAHFDTRIALSQQEVSSNADLLIALHARRSAASIAQWHAQCPNKPIVLVLTGTDLYRDIQTDDSAQRSLELATALVVLQEQGLQELPAQHRAKAQVIYQSAPRLPAFAKPHHPFTVAMVGHLRDEKDPLTFLKAVELLAHRNPIEFHHFGQMLDPKFIAPLAATGWRNERYHWHNGVSPEAARAALQQAHLSVLTSHMEGGAHVILESVMAGTPVIASRVGGNLGMLGADYEGYFEPGNAEELAHLIDRAEQDRDWLERLHSQTKTRTCLFEPALEKTALLHLLKLLLPHQRQ